MFLSTVKLSPDNRTAKLVKQYLSGVYFCFLTRLTQQMKDAYRHLKNREAVRLHPALSSEQGQQFPNSCFYSSIYRP